MLDKSQPFGLPKGTIRALIAIIFAIAILGQFPFDYIIPDYICSIGISFIGYYFGLRSEFDKTENNI